MSDSVEIGVDIVDIDRLWRITQETDSFVTRWFHVSEYGLRIEKLAGSLAVKKAMYKSLGGRIYIPPQNVFLLHDETGKPHLGFDSSFISTLNRYLFSISISYTVSLAFAAVLTSIKRGAS